MTSEFATVLAVEQQKWGPHCVACGHPSTYHTTTRCLVDAGAESKARCDCKGYLHPAVYAAARPGIEGSVT